VDDVVFDELKTGMIEQGANVLDAAGEKIADAKDPMPVRRTLQAAALPGDVIAT